MRVTNPYEDRIEIEGSSRQSHHALPNSEIGCSRPRAIPIQYSRLPIRDADIHRAQSRELADPATGISRVGIQHWVGSRSEKLGG